LIGDALSNPVNQAKELKGSPHHHVQSFPFLPFPNDQIRRRCHCHHPDQELGVVFKRTKGPAPPYPHKNLKDWLSQGSHKVNNPRL